MDAVTETHMRPPKVEVVRAHEKMVQLPDRNIVVIGTDHGRIEVKDGKMATGSFAGKAQTEQELADVFKGNLSALAVDSMIMLDDPDEPKTDILSQDIVDGTRPESDVKFLGWAVRKAAEKNIPLVTVDPINTIDSINIVSTAHLFFEGIKGGLGMIDENSPYATEEYIQVTNDLKQLQETQQYVTTLGVGGATAAGTGAIILSALESKKHISRRGMMRGLSALAGGAALGGAGVVTAEVQLSQQIDELQQQKGKLLSEIQNRQQEDRAFRDRLMLEVKEIEQTDYANPSMQRLAEENASKDIGSLILRNAIAAEVLTLPLSDILPDFDTTTGEKPNIATIWGSDHLVLPEKYQISYLLTHEDERRQIIRSLLGSFLEQVKISKDMPADSKTKTKEQFENFGKTFTVDKQGAVTSHHFPVPFIDKIVKTSFT